MLRRLEVSATPPLLLDANDLGHSTRPRPFKHPCWRLVLEDGAATAQCGCFCKIMGDKHRRHAAPAQEFGKLPHEAPPCRLIERGERLVEKQYFRIEHQRPRQARPLRLTSGDHADGTVSKMIDLELFQHQSDPRFALGFADPP